MAKHTITINGQLYDAVTGLPVDGMRPAEAAVPKPQPTKASAARVAAQTASSVHERSRKSTTLRRGHLAVPKSTLKPSRARRQAGHVPRSAHITHFAAHPKPLPRKAVAATPFSDIGPSLATLKKRPVTPPARVVKEQLIARAGRQFDATRTEKTEKGHETTKAPRRKFFSLLRTRHIVAACIALVLLGGYVTYLSMPSLSVRLAASQAGVNAKYPNYSPDGYSFQGPVAFNQGQVELHFKANGGGAGYTIRQQSSNWNSVAVLDNFVSEKSRGDYQATTQSGVVIYTYGTHAAWTNGGVLYTIDGDAPLSSDQLLRIAGSM